MLTARSWIPAVALLFSLIAAGCSKSSSPEPGGVEPLTRVEPPSALTAYGLTARAANSAATLSWPDINGAIAYNVYWSTGASVSIASATKIANVASPYTHTELSNDIAYRYLFTAVTAAGESAPSNVAIVTPTVQRKGAPANVEVIAGDGRVTLTWDAVPNATSYSVYWNTTGDVSSQDHKVGNITYPAVHTGLTNGQQYYYIITATTPEFGEVASAEISTAPHIAPPNPPLSVTVSAGDQQANLSWTAVSDATSYAIYWSDHKDVTLADTRIDVAASPYAHTSRTNGTRYFYRIAALNAQGPSVLSAEVTAKPHAPAPGTPSKLTAAVGNEQITLTWEPVAGASQYNLYWDSGAAVTVIANVQPPYVHKPLKDRMPVNYAVSALREGVESASSGQISATPLGPLPPMPAQFAATPAKQQVTLTWAAVDGALGYRVYWHTQDNPAETLITTSATPSYTHTGLLDNTSYLYRIEAITADGTSPSSTEITVTTLPASVPAATGPPSPIQTYTVGGHINGLVAASTGLVLTLTDTHSEAPIETLPITSGATSAFNFKSALQSGGTYTVAVSASPDTPISQTCGVDAGTETVKLGTVNIASVAITCTTNTYTVSGSVMGLAGTGFMLNNGTPLTLTDNAFSITLASGADYNIFVETQPANPTQTCLFTSANNRGTVTNTNVVVPVNCTTNNYAIGGTIRNLTANGLSLSLKNSSGAIAEVLTINSGASFAFLNTIPSGDTYTIVIATYPTGQTCQFANSSNSIAGNVINAPVSEAVACSANPAYTANFNDTGITASQCYQAGSDVLVDCGSAGAIALNPAQDGMTGRDMGATNGNTDGKLGFNFASVPGGCVQDNITGLMWEVKTTDGGLRDWTKTYTNYSTVSDSIPSTYGTATDASGFVTAVNATNLCGYSDWHLPTAEELQSIVDYGMAFPGPNIDVTWFPNTQSYGFWSASPNVAAPIYAWLVGFSDGGVGLAYRSDANPVRLVRAGQLPILPRYTVSADGQEVTDSQTHLIWRRCSEGMSWDSAAIPTPTCVGTANLFTHEAAVTHARDQASSTGIAWRLPNIRELASIADKNLFNLAIDATAFPATPTPNSQFWSASPYVGVPTNAWVVDFYYGVVGTNLRVSSSFVRLVRAGQ